MKNIKKKVSQSLDLLTLSFCMRIDLACKSLLMLIMLILSKAILPSTIFDNLDRNLHLHHLLFALHLQIAPCSFLWMNNARIVDFALKCDWAYLVWSTQMCSQFIGCGWKCWWFSGVCVYFATLCISCRWKVDAFQVFVSILGHRVSRPAVCCRYLLCFFSGKHATHTLQSSSTSLSSF